MKYVVRSAEGELVYQSFGEVERAWLQGLVEPEDEIREEGAQTWRKAKSYALLAKARRHGDAVWGGTQAAWMMFAVVMGSIALYLLARGHWLAGLLIATGLGTVLIQVTMRAFKRTRPH